MDKVMHAITSYALSLTIALFAIRISGIWWAQFVAFALTMIIGVGKELYDQNHSGNHFCKWDIVADGIGAIAGTNMSLIVATTQISV